MRQILIRLVFEQGQSIQESADILGIKYSTAKSIANIYEKNGIINKQTKGGRECNILTSAILEEIENMISENPG
jgi:transposase